LINDGFLKINHNKIYKKIIKIKRPKKKGNQKKKIDFFSEI